jgi:hypothetical protein
MLRFPKHSREVSPKDGGKSGGRIPSLREIATAINAAACVEKSAFLLPSSSVAIVSESNPPRLILGIEHWEKTGTPEAEAVERVLNVARKYGAVARQATTTPGAVTYYTFTPFRAGTERQVAI